MLKVASFTGSSADPASRFRVRQYINNLTTHGVTLHDFQCEVGTYPPQSKLMRPIWGIRNITSHLAQIANSRSYDVVILQREMMSTLYTCERFVKNPKILDVDDAIFLHRNGIAARKLAQNADMVVCGNTFLASWFSQYNKNIEIIPTGIDIHRYIPKTYESEQKEITLVWSGSSSGYHFLYAIEPALKNILQNNKNVRLRVIADKPPNFRMLSAEQVSYFKWSIDTEVDLLKTADIGLMPLSVDDWSRGKCSFKMLTYMACRLPVVVTPVGMNQDVLNLGMVGLPATTETEWQYNLQELINDPALMQTMGQAGRIVVERSFNASAIAENWSNILKNIAGGKY